MAKLGMGLMRLPLVDENDQTARHDGQHEHGPVRSRHKKDVYHPGKRRMLPARREPRQHERTHHAHGGNERFGFQRYANKRTTFFFRQGI